MFYSLNLVARFVKTVFPLVDKELGNWDNYVREHTSGELARQALASISEKKFHCQGGSIYCLYPGTTRENSLRLIVALQTISDYLDNLCDRTGIADEQAFRQLHLAMIDALSPGKTPADYYRNYPCREDGGYLAKLVETCRLEVSRLPSYQAVRPHVLELTELYCTLQSLKHLDKACREDKIRRWAGPQLEEFPQLSTWEFAAATGSTLAIFMLCALASIPGLAPSQALCVRKAYFPWICGLHILLDYLIDRAEDCRDGELNFVAYYPSEETVAERMIYVNEQALAKAASLPDSQFHTTIIQGLLALYLSDPKATCAKADAVKHQLLHSAGQQTTLFYQICRLLRRSGKI